MRKDLVYFFQKLKFSSLSYMKRENRMTFSLVPKTHIKLIKTYCSEFWYKREKEVKEK